MDRRAQNISVRALERIKALEEFGSRLRSPWPAGGGAGDASCRGGAEHVSIVTAAGDRRSR
jgi:hypothetical protein